jgi:hypothetical protein
MALDLKIREGANSAAKGNRRDAKIIERGYLASKRRAREALIALKNKLFSIREEHRVR